MYAHPGFLIMIKRKKAVKGWKIRKHFECQKIFVTWSASEAETLEGTKELFFTSGFSSFFSFLEAFSESFFVLTLTPVAWLFGTGPVALYFRNREKPNIKNRTERENGQKRTQVFGKKFYWTFNIFLHGGWPSPEQICGLILLERWVGKQSVNTMNRGGRRKYKWQWVKYFGIKLKFKPSSCNLCQIITMSACTSI